jgi:MYXO-CTERM domain-containing protein
LTTATVNTFGLTNFDFVMQTSGGTKNWTTGQQVHSSFDFSDTLTAPRAAQIVETFTASFPRVTIKGGTATVTFTGVILGSENSEVTGSSISFSAKNLGVSTTQLMATFGSPINNPIPLSAGSYTWKGTVDVVWTPHQATDTLTLDQSVTMGVAPVPPTIVLAGLGVLCLAGGFAWRRRRVPAYAR